MNNSLHILALAYVYPPDSGSGTFRPLYFMNNLAKRGVSVSVITVRTEDFHVDASVDTALVNKIHPDIKVIRCSVKRPMDALIDIKNKIFNPDKASNRQSVNLVKPIHKKKRPTPAGVIDYFSDIISGVLTCPDHHVGWIPDVLKKARHLIKQEKTDYIYATGGPWSCVLAGALLHKISGLPLILDFRDPWISNPNFFKKPPFLRYLEKKMEAFVINSAKAVIANTNELRADFLNRYSCLNEKNTHTITNGFEKIEHPVAHQKNKYFSLVHAGELYMSRNPANLLKAIEELIKEGKINNDLFRIKFVGGISINDLKLNELLRSQYLENVIELYPRVSHSEALLFQQGADVLLLIQPDFPLQIPRKLFEYISLQKTVLAITEACSATGNIIRSKHLGVVVENSMYAIKTAVLEMYQLWEKNQLLPLNIDEVSEFSNEVLAGKLEKIIREIVGK